MLETPPPEEKSLSQKILTVAAITMGVGFGTCSLAAVTVSGYRYGWVFIWIGAAAFFLSLAVILVTMIVVIATVVVERFRR